MLQINIFVCVLAYVCVRVCNENLFRKLQCGGIIYDSVQTKGFNVLSYYPSDFVCVKKSEKMFEVKSVGYKINDIQDGRSKYKHWFFNDEKVEEKYGSDT